MRIGRLVAVGWLMVAGALAAQRAKTVHVAADGSAEFRTVQEALDSAPGGNVRVEIAPGTYRAVVTVTANHVELRGMGKRPEDVVLVYDNVASAVGGTSHTATVTVNGDNFVAENLTISNDWEKTHARTEEGSQAVALKVDGDREVFRRVRLLGYQDTLYANSRTCHNAGDAGPCRASRQYFADCYIEGHVDFIFGDAKAVFDHCELHGLAHEMVMLTAQSRVRADEDSGYVFRDCTVTADAGVKDLLLGRPWRDYSTVIWLDTDFKAPVDPRGWLEWAGRLKTSTYAEYHSHGATGDLARRVAPSRQLTAAEVAQYSVKAWLAGEDGWEPAKAAF